MNRYYCQSCGMEHIFSHPPKFCPDCGNMNTMVKDNRKARETALRKIDELKTEDIPAMESIFSSYMAQRVAVEVKMQTLRTYKRRGIVSEEEMPVLERPRLQEKLAEYRRLKGETEDGKEV